MSLYQEPYYLGSRSGPLTFWKLSHGSSMSILKWHGAPAPGAIRRGLAVWPHPGSCRTAMQEPLFETVGALPICTTVRVPHSQGPIFSIWLFHLFEHLIPQIHLEAMWVIVWAYMLLASPETHSSGPAQDCRRTKS